MVNDLFSTEKLMREIDGDNPPKATPAENSNLDPTSEVVKAVVSVMFDRVWPARRRMGCELVKKPLPEGGSERPPISTIIQRSIDGLGFVTFTVHVWNEV